MNFKSNKQIIASQLTEMSFEQIQQLKTEIGSKVFDAVLNKSADTNTSSKPATTTFKRDNKNKPRELSSKRKVIYKQRWEKSNANKSQTAPLLEQVHRDPRFDERCGEFNKDSFETNYDFVDEIKSNEQKELSKMMHECEDEEERERIKQLLLNMRNQQKNKELTKKRSTRIANSNTADVIYKRKSDTKFEDLIEQYERLKKTRKVKKYIDRRSLKLAKRDYIAKKQALKNV